MIEKLANLWDEPCDARCITTNGFIKKNGSLVMGAGVAGQAQARYPNLPKIAGDFVQTYGNIVGIFTVEHLLGEYKPWKEHEYFITFPVKHAWYEKADLALIERSAYELMAALNEPGFIAWKKVLLPLPGCGNGQLSWSDVKPVIAPILDDRVWVISNLLTKDFNPQS
jgi:hypothetical protein